jgi:acylphosphatase
MAVRTVRVVISGEVQGVGYRDWTSRRATRRELAGWVRNRRDGTVEALFSGDAGAVDDMLAACRIGPPSASVADVRVEDAPDPGATEFTIRPTE